jgi:hypothetical protein
MSAAIRFVSLLVLVGGGLPARAGSDGGAAFILLGDLHYDRLDDHDEPWLKARPDDYRQVTQEYTVYTREHWADLMQLLLRRSRTLEPPVAGLVQLGDLQEGLAGTPELARRMTRHAVEALRPRDFAAPWILVKGNHDVTGPGAREAFDEIVLPFLRDELRQEIPDANYACRIGDAEFIGLDGYGGYRFLDVLEKMLEASTARYRFVAIHQPVIPVTARCWHVLGEPKDQAARERLLTLLARHRAVVLCAHLHKYSVVRRMTPAGPVVQVMINSVIRETGDRPPYWYTTEYGESLLAREPRFSPDTQVRRAAVLREEARHVTHFRLADLPGYGVLTTGGASGDIRLRVYPGLSEKAQEEVDLGVLLDPGPATAPH